MKIGILGGTFNPIHNGHIEMILKAADEFDLDDVLLIPTGNPPHKPNKEILSKYERYELCLLSAAEYDNVFVSSIEIDRKGYTYTIDTLKELEKVFGIRDGIYFIVGGDTVLQLENWKDFGEVVKRCNFIAFGRIGMDSTKILDKIDYIKQKYNADISYLAMDIAAIASSDIRKRIKNGETYFGLMPKRVEEYIAKHNLYK